MGNLRGLLTIVSLVFVGAGCFTNHGEFSSASTNTKTTLSDANSGSGDAGYLVSLAQVIPNASDPTGTFDLVGDGSGEIGDYCATTTTSSDGSSASVCTCVFNYIRETGAEEEVEVAPTYVESNLLRCKYSSSVPSDADYVQVKIHFTNSDTYSSEITYQFGAGSVSLDTSSASSFSLVSRYQCRDVVTVPHILFPDIYDPYQSENDAYSYPLNFYTTNMGQALLAFATSDYNKEGLWNCPPKPNDPDAGMDLTLFSVTSDGSSKRIYPATGSEFDRSTFYLTKKSSGSFNVAVHVMLAPNVNTTNPDSAGAQAAGTYAPIGYGVRPTTTADGETCPSDVTIPSGYHWVKVWLFRASLTPRYAAGSNVFTNTTVSCNPGTYNGQSDGTLPYPDCDRVPGADPQTNYPIGDSGELADRVITTQAGTNVCVNIRDGATGGASGVGFTTDSTTLVQKDDYELFATGTDFWDLVGGEDELASGGASYSNAYNLWDANYPGVPHDPAPSQVSIDSGVSRYDFVFVVSPTTVMAKDMKNATSASLPYTPYRFAPPSACSSLDPDSPTIAGDCPSSKRINYQLRMTDLSVNPDSAAEDPSRLPTFPVCAIQPDT